MKDIVDLYKLADITDVIQAYPNTLTKHTHTHTHTHTHSHEEKQLSTKVFETKES